MEISTWIHYFNLGIGVTIFGLAAKYDFESIEFYLGIPLLLLVFYVLNWILPKHLD